MTDKERLQDIKNRFMKHEYDYALSGDDVVWLIKQAERVEKLQLEVNDWRDETIKWNKRFEESEESHSETKELLYSTISENKRYKQALEHFANFGTNHDTNPTLVMDGNEVFMLLGYIKSMDEYVRCKAQKALEG